jgi:hypothetical protein
MKELVEGKDGGLHFRTIKKKDIVEMPIEEIPTDYVEHWKLMYRINEDLLRHLMKWDNIDSVPINGWEEIRKKIHEEKINLRRIKGVYYRKKHVDIFEKYTIDELKKLYENNGLWSVTRYFVNYLTKHNDQIILNYDNNDEAKRCTLRAKEDADYLIQNEYCRSDKELSETMVKLHANDFLHQLYEEDEDNHSDIYDFIINNLQYASIEDLKKLCKLNEKDFLIKGKGRKSKNKKIFKYDLEHNLLNTYPNRNACIDAEQISKQSLYNVLSGKRKQLKGFIYEEEQ